jgi:hypothetical protein
MSRVEILVAPTADNQGLAMARRHHLDPEGLLSLPLRVEIGQAPDVVHLDLYL